MKSKKSINILGAGIGGLTSAFVLSKSGYIVNIFEKKTDIGSPFPFHYNVIRNYNNHEIYHKLSNMGLKISPLKIVSDSIRISPNYHFKISGNLYYLFERGASSYSLESQIYRQLIDNPNVHFYFNQRDVVECEIISTGIPMKKANIFGVGYKYIPVNNNEVDNKVIVFYDNNISPNGYLCILPGESAYMLLSVSFTEKSVETLFRIRN